MVKITWPNFFKVFAPLLSIVFRPIPVEAQVRYIRQPEYLTAIAHGRIALKTMRETADIPGLAVAVGI
ncbi:MAG TPA: hypothetical protein PK198_14615, partial [Saprospiraceae bacterium]|nr:hypothetical protein [Saprospiraceae bacterium]